MLLVLIVHSYSSEDVPTLTIEHHLWVGAVWQHLTDIQTHIETNRHTHICVTHLIMPHPRLADLEVKGHV